MMRPEQLIGKRAVRTAPIKHYSGVIDTSFTTNPIKILKVTDTHIVYEHSWFDGWGLLSVLDSQWIDDNWIDYDELISLDETAQQPVDESAEPPIV